MSKIESKIDLSKTEFDDVLKMPTNYLICYLHGFLEAQEQLRKVKQYIRNIADKTTYIKYKEAMRILRKVKYN